MKLTAIVLTHNEESMLAGCLETLSWVDELVVVDKKSQDKTVEIAKQYKAKISHFDGEHFDEWRNEALQQATGDWVMYIDPDERITDALQHEIQIAIQSDKGAAAYRMPRKNYWWGKEFNNCGASPDYVTRLFKATHLKKWQGIIHESPIVDGEIETLNNQLIHLTHRDLISGLKKSYSWTKFEAQLLYEAHHPSVTWWRLGKVTLTSFMKKYIQESGYKEGTAGFIESAVQAWNRFMVYEQLWELQQKPSLEKTYAQLGHQK